MIHKLRTILTRRDKQFLIFLFVLSVAVSVIETVGISIIMPFIAIAMDFTLVYSNQYYQAVYVWLNFSQPQDFVMAFGVFLIFFYIFRSGINLMYVYLLNRFSQGRYHLIAYRLFENYMGMRYKEFIQKNSSSLTKSIINEASNLTLLIQNILFIMSEICIVIFLYAMMLYVNYKITLLLTAILTINAIFLTQTVSKKIKQAGKERADIQEKFYEIISQSFGNYKLIKLDNNDNDILKKFAQSSYGYAHANIKANTLSQFPRLFLEAIGFGLIAFIVTYLVWKYEGNIASMLSMISMFVLSLYRLMPSVNRIMSSYNAIMFYRQALDIVHNDLMYDSEILGNKKLKFENTIVLSNIFFQYDKEKYALEHIDLTIKKGSKIAFVGESGSGKSTLVDLIMGLYKPAKGTIKIDDTLLCDETIKDWRHKIGYIPQHVYLFDGTVAQNVVFGKSLNEQRLTEVLKQANIYDFLQTKEGILTQVGEGGVMLSGGQKQRIAIARALYKNPEILVLDEATSALDTQTESKIMEEIYKISQHKTLIIIAHRLSTLKGCDDIYTLHQGKIILDQTLKSI